MDFFDDDFGLAGLTQEAKLEDNVANFNIGYDYIEEGIVSSNVVSLEDYEGDKKMSVLYDNVMAEDISSDEELDAM